MTHRQDYSRVYNEHKQLQREAMNDAIKRFQESDPERFAELQTQAKHELEHPPERIVTRYPIKPHFNVSEYVRLHHTQDYYIHTKDCWGNSHTYFESLNGETPEEKLARRHPKFVERDEKVTEVTKCTCPLCQELN